jgi:hypothetical protein
MDFEGKEFVKLKERKTDVVRFEHLEDSLSAEQDKERISLRSATRESGLFMFQITGVDSRIMLYACRMEGDPEETGLIRAEVRKRIARVFANKWNTTGFLSFLSNIEYKNRWFDEKGWDKETGGDGKVSEAATEQQVLFAETIINKRMDIYPELIRIRTFLRNMQAVDDDFEQFDKAKTAAKARALLLKKDIVCRHIYKDKDLKVVRKGRRACCEPCASAGYLSPDAEFGKKMEDGVEIGFLKAI